MSVCTFSPLAAKEQSLLTSLQYSSSPTVFSGRVWGKKKTPGELRSPLWLVDTLTLQQGTAANL